MVKLWKVALVVLILIAPASGQDWFGAPRLFMTNDPVRVVINVDADGDLDLVRVMPGAGGATGFTVMVNPGNADFVDATPVALPAGVGVVVAGGDVTGDGRPDLVFATTATYIAGSGFLVYPGSPSGTFGAPSHKSIPGSVVQALHLADVTGDGMLDVGAYLVNATQGTFNWNPSLGGGSFASWPGVTIPAAQLSPTKASLVLDTNADGTPDAAIFGTAGIVFCPTIGNASVLGPTISIATSASQDAFAAGDVDGDGDVDILYAGGTPNPTFPTAMLTNLVRVMNLGGGLWSTPVQQTFTGQAFWTNSRLFVGDWDIDGQPDVVLTTPRPFATAPLAQIRIFAGSASGSFSLGVAMLAVEVDPGGVGVFEVSGDGIPDFVGGFEVVFGVGGMTSPFGQLAGNVLTGNARDWDDDGDLDFASATGVGSYSVNDGRGVITPLQLTLPPPPGNVVVGPQSVPGDFNGDRRPDWLVGIATPPSPPSFPFGLFHHHRIYSDAGNGTLVDLGMAAPTATVIPATAGAFGKPSPVVDMNGDGLDDVVASDTIWYSNGAGFAPGTVNFFGAVPIATGDVDGDFDVDLIVATWAFPTSTATLLLNAGGGSFIWLPIDTGSSALAEGRFADLDDDGDVDVLLGYGTVLVSTGSPVHLIENLSNTGAVAHQLAFPTLASLPLVVSDVDAGDVDGDGNTDLVLGLSQTFSGPPLVAAFAVLRRVGPGLTYEVPRVFAAPSLTRLADLDDDGDLDVCGQSFLFNRRFVAPAAGSSRQYGVGSPGTGGIVPILGRSGPLRPGLFASIRIRRGYGAVPGVLVLGGAPSNVTYPGLPGITSYAEPWTDVLPILIGGPSGLAGGGLLDFGDFIPPAIAGTSVYCQVGLVDPAGPAMVSVTNGLEIIFGM